MKWTEDQAAKLRELAFEGKSNLEMAQALCMPIAEIYAKRSSLGLTIAKVNAIKNGENPAQINAKNTTLSAEKSPLTRERQLACAAYHLAYFSYCARNKQVADWVFPCEICDYNNVCDFNEREHQRLLY